MSQSIDHREVLGRLLSTQQQVIDLKAQLDREHLIGEGFRRLGERAFEAKSLDEFFALVTEEVVATFGTENAVLLRFGADAASILGTCCADDATGDEICDLSALVMGVPPGRARLLTEGPLPPLRGRATAVVLLGSFVDKSDHGATYGVLATISQAKAPFYPTLDPEFAPMFAAFLNHVGALQQHLRGRDATLALIRATQRFVPQEFLMSLGHEDVTTARLGDAVQKRMTVMFADIREFTSISERMAPADTAAFLNGCLSRLGPQIRAHGGFVDKYIGDAILALFPGDPIDAVAASLAMHREMTQTASPLAEQAHLVIGVGIHFGDVMLCTVGEVERFEATVISDTVNLAARLETLTKQLGCATLVSAEVARTLPPQLADDTRELGAFAVKGKRESVSIVEVFGSDDDALRACKRETKEGFATALKQFACGQVASALEIVAGLAADYPDDRPLAWWHQHLQRELASPDQRSDAGVVRLEAK